MFLDILSDFGHQRKNRQQHCGNYTCNNSPRFSKMSQQCY